MSKSKGNLISANELLEQFDMDTLRFYFTFNGPETKDTNCSIEEIIQVHNKFLVGVLGNFVNRNLSFVTKKFDGIIKEGKINKDIQSLTRETYDKVGKYIENAEFKLAITNIMEYISAGNKYYDDSTPWVKVKEDINAFNDITYTCAYMIANISNLIAPFMPNGSKKIRKMLNLENYSWQEIMITGDLRVSELELLYTKIG